MTISTTPSVTLTKFLVQMNNSTIISREKLVVPKVWTGVSALAVFFSGPLEGEIPPVCFISTSVMIYHRGASLSEQHMH